MQIEFVNLEVEFELKFELKLFGRPTYMVIN